MTREQHELTMNNLKIKQDKEIAELRSKVDDLSKRCAECTIFINDLKLDNESLRDNLSKERQEVMELNVRNSSAGRKIKLLKKLLSEYED